MADQFFYKKTTEQPAFATETPIRGFEPTRPYPQNPYAIVYRTRFMQLRAYYTRPTANTPHPNLPQVYFADDIDFQDRTSGMIEWTRVYTTIPTQWNDFESEAYNYPGFLYRATPSQRGRNPFTHIVTTKVVKDYYIVGNLTAFQNNITNYDNPAAWSNTGVGLSGNSRSIPACAGGANYATAVVASGGFQAHFISQSVAAQPVGLTTASVFVKKDPTSPSSKVQVAMADLGGIKGSVSVDLDTGQPIGTPNGNGYSIIAIGDGWWRVNATGNAANTTLGIRVYVLDNNGNVNYSESTPAEGIQVWRGQVYSGNTAPYATVPPTVASDGTTNYPIASADQIPQTFGLQYLYEPNIAQASNISVEYLSNGSQPNYSSYNANVVTDQGNANSYSIESQDSVQTLWYGSIWERNRKFVKAR